jgi:predicted GH43/DUF377 family glycosyl hydrolase
MNSRSALVLTALTLILGGGSGMQAASHVVPAKDVGSYPDGRPAARWRLDAKDHGVVLRHGDGPDRCDALGARDVWVWHHAGTYHMHYDGAGPKGWLACLATSGDAQNWTAKGPVLDLGPPGSNDSAAAAYGTTYQDGARWHMFYLGTPNVTPAPDLIPGFPYLTMKAESATPTGPWRKRNDVNPFQLKPGSYYSGCASPGHIIKQGDEYLMFFSASTDGKNGPVLRTIGLARTRNLDDAWTISDQPLLPPAEQVENTSLYFEEENKTWFMFTNHVGIRGDIEYTDAVWVYWSKELTKWDPAQKAVVLDSRNCSWSKHIIGLPSVVPAGRRLAVFYDGNADAGLPPGEKSHMGRDIGLAWLDLPLVPPQR